MLPGAGLFTQDALKCFAWLDPSAQRMVAGLILASEGEYETKPGGRAVVPRPLGTRK